MLTAHSISFKVFTSPMHAPEPQLTRRKVYIFGFTSLCNDIASEMGYWILPAFLISLGAGPAALGLIEGIAERVASLGKFFSGYLTDIIARLKPLVIF